MLKKMHGQENSVFVMKEGQSDIAAIGDEIGRCFIEIRHTAGIRIEAEHIQGRAEHQAIIIDPGYTRVGLKDIIPACDRRGNSGFAISHADRSPQIQHGVGIAGIKRAVFEHIINIGEVWNIGKVERMQQILAAQQIGRGRLREDQIIALGIALAQSLNHFIIVTVCIIDHSDIAERLKI